jgi:large subunit ribosomal protein L35
MPKMKTHRGAAKRFRVTRTGKVRFKHSKMRHNTGLKRKVVKKRLIKVSSLTPGDARHIKALLPYA